MTLDVTVVIPIHRDGNRDWLQQAIDSIPDGVPYLVVENDGEVADAINHGFREAKTELVCLMGADDLWAPGALELLVDLAWDCDVTYPSMLLVDTDLNPLGEFPADPFCPNRLLVWNYIPGVGVIRRDKYLAAGGARDMEQLEDWDAWVRMSRAGARFKPVPEAVYLYRQVPGSRNKGVVRPGFEDEMRKLIVGDRPVHKATFYYQATYATTYWRCLVPARQLPGACQPFLDIASPDGRTIEFPRHEGAAVFQFAGDPARAISMAYMRQQGYRTLIEVDDNYLEVPPQMESTGWSKQMVANKSSIEAHRRMVSDPDICDGVIVTTPTLADCYRNVAKNVYVCPNSIDPSDWTAWEKPDDGVLRIGWFASASHRGDRHLLAQAMRWASRQPNVEVWFMGSFNPFWNCEYTHAPWSNDLGVYRRVLHSLDVGVAPIAETPWSVCRSDLKPLEYAMAGVAPILSDAPPYSNWENERGCLKVNGQQGFLQAVKRLVKNPDETRQLAADARAYVMSERTIDKTIGCWEEAVQ